MYNIKRQTIIDFVLKLILLVKRNSSQLKQCFSLGVALLLLKASNILFESIQRNNKSE